MIKSLKLLPRYIKNLGLFSGMMTFLNVEFFQKSEFRFRGYAHKIFLRPSTTDRKVFREIFLFNAYGFQIDPPKIIVDGGANIGLSSIFFATRFPAAKIYAIEPEQTNFDVLMK